MRKIDWKNVKTPLKPLWEKMPWRISRQNMELRQLLQEAEKNLNYWFHESMSEYIEVELLPRAREAIAKDYHGETYIKKFRSRFKSFNGLSAYQNFILELDCLSLINSLPTDRNCLRHFPKLLDFDLADKTITMSNQGTSLHRLNRRVVIPEFELQISRMLQILHDAEVIHLDMNPSGRNLVVDQVGVLSIIDFDCAVARGRPFSESYRTRIDFYQTTKERIIDICARNKFVTI